MTFYYKVRGKFLNERQYWKWEQKQPRPPVNITLVVVNVHQEKPKTGTLLDYMETM